ncbi:hypothetical protein NGM37_27490 [Streptomyces sp. TRM76130]|nr:hypothetical protein [Streptomyces sp. TRM76130]
MTLPGARDLSLALLHHHLDLPHRALPVAPLGALLRAVAARTPPAAADRAAPSGGRRRRSRPPTR